MSGSSARLRLRSRTRASSPESGSDSAVALALRRSLCERAFWPPRRAFFFLRRLGCGLSGRLGSSSFREPRAPLPPGLNAVAAAREPIGARWPPREYHVRTGAGSRKPPGSLRQSSSLGSSASRAKAAGADRVSRGRRSEWSGQRAPDGSVAPSVSHCMNGYRPVPGQEPIEARNQILQ